MFTIIKKMFIVLLASIVNASNHVKCVSLSNCEIQSTLINLHPNEYSQNFHYYPFAVKLDGCVGSGNTLNDLSNNVCVPNKTDDLDLGVFNMITVINEAKTLTKHISCECKCKFDGRKCNSDQWWNNDKCQCDCKKHHFCEKDYVWNPATCNCENGKYLASIMVDSGIICDEIVYEEETNFNERNIAFKTQNFYILLTFLLITITSLIAVSIYCYLIKYRVKQKHLLSFHVAKLKQIYIDNINWK